MKHPKSVKEQWQEAADAIHNLAKVCGVTFKEFSEALAKIGKATPKAAKAMRSLGMTQEFYGEDYHELKVKVQDANGPLNLIGHNAFLKLQVLDGAELVLEKTTHFRDLSNAEAFIKLTPAETKKLCPGEYNYILRLINDGAITTLVSDKMIVKPPIGGGMKLTTNSPEIEIDREPAREVKPNAPKTAVKRLDKEHNPKKLEGYYK